MIIRDEIMKDVSKPPNVLGAYQNMNHEEIMEHQPKLGYAVCVLSLLGGLNVGIIQRTAVIFGADKFFIAGRKRYDKRSTVGAENYIETIHLDHKISDDEIDCDKVFDDIISSGYNPVLVELGGEYIADACCYETLPENPCFILGSEATGIPEHIVKSEKFPMVSIRQFGVLRSLNVSTAASIIMYEYTK